MARSWLEIWREVAELSSGLTKEDPRLPGVLMVIDRLTEEYKKGDLKGFLREVERLRDSMANGESTGVGDAQGPVP